MARQSIKSMSRQAVDEQPVSFDFSEGYPEEWDYTAAARCEKCKKVVVGEVTEYGGKHSEFDNDSECDGYLSASPPMMNYYYPLSEGRLDVEEAAGKIVDLPLCIVEIDGDVMALALTGGGMNLGWEICQAYMTLGILPPAHFAAALPRMSGRGHSPRDRWIIAGCRASLLCVLSRAKYSLKSLSLNFPPSGK